MGGKYVKYMSEYDAHNVSCGKTSQQLINSVVCVSLKGQLKGRQVQVPVPLSSSFLYSQRLYAICHVCIRPIQRLADILH